MAKIVVMSDDGATVDSWTDEREELQDLERAGTRADIMREIAAAVRLARQLEKDTAPCQS